ncbi:MAG: hypothetical protein IPK99_01415 [Flavobacteriales bacterium]|nr:hypothetical protein [Flavobacteriales bacterium]
MLSGETDGTMQVTRENNTVLPELHLGDVVRMERMTPELIAQVAQLARSAVNDDTLAVAYFEGRYGHLPAHGSGAGDGRLHTFRADTHRRLFRPATPATTRSRHGRQHRLGVDSTAFAYPVDSTER